MKNLIFVLTLSFFTLFSCIDRDYAEPNANDCVSLEANKTVEEVFSMATTTATEYLADDIIEGYVTSSDDGGNFFKSLSVVSTDNTRGFSVPVDVVTLFADFEPGRKVYIKLKGKHITIDHSSLHIGNPNLDFPQRVNRLELFEYKNIIKKGCEKINEDNIVKKSSNISSLVNNQNLHSLIEFENVQFNDPSLGRNLFDPDLNNIGNATNHEIVDASGNKVIVRVSSFSNFSGKPVPSGSGKIRGVLTQFNGAFQFMVRTIDDINMTEDRFEVDLFPPKGGTNITYFSSLNETFESYPTGASSEAFPSYINDPVVGSRYWRVATFGGNKYIQLTSFGGTPEANRTLFAVPVNFSSANNFSFKTKAGFNNGNVLKVYYSTNYTPLSNVNNATLVDITSNFSISPGQSSGYPTNFTNSGNWAIPASISGNGFIFFEYVGNGNGGPTTTMQIDDIVIN